jgi:hypothetical protein
MSTQDSDFEAIGGGWYGFWTDSASIDFGTHVHGNRCGVLADSSSSPFRINPQPDLPFENLGVLGHGDTVGVYGVRGRQGPVNRSQPRFTDGAGVIGTASERCGVVGTSSGGAGVYGQFGEESRLAVVPAGVVGSSLKLAGVIGSSTGNIGVLGQSETSTGVSGASNDQIGTFGVSGSSGPAFGDGKEFASAGVMGTGADAFGVVGTSFKWSGVVGQSGKAGPPFPVTAGVLGSAAAAVGVAGISANNSGVSGTTGKKPPALAVTAGVSGTTAEAIGVAGTSLGGIGVYGRLGARTSPFDIGAPMASGIMGVSLIPTANLAAFAPGVIGVAEQTGVLGVSATSTNTSFGVWGLTGGAGPPPPAPYTDGPAGVYGTSVLSPGVIGTSQAQPGVLGFSIGQPGLFGVSNNSVGVYGQSTNSFAGYFSGNVYVQGTSAGPYAVDIQGNLRVNGSITAIGKDAVVPFPDGTQRVLHCMESPEHWFEDFGTAKLVRGRTVVKLDADFAKVVKLGDFRVFLTPEGDCQGLYVRGKRGASFEVRELQGGTSSIAFCYRIVGKRKDIKTQARFAKIDMSIPKLAAKPPTASPRKGAALPVSVRKLLAGLAARARTSPKTRGRARKRPA